MDLDLVLIFSFIITIIVLGMGTAQLIHRRVVRHEERKLELEAQIEQAKAQQTNRGDVEYRKFEERLRVLERIVTDGNSTLAAQIEQLRLLDAVESQGVKERAL